MTTKLTKTARIPAIRVNPAFRQALDKSLKEGESISDFVEEAVRIQVERRREDEAFLQRALASRDKALKTKSYHSADEVHGKLREMLQEAKNKIRG